MILIIAATPLETTLIRQHIKAAKTVRRGIFSLTAGKICQQDVLIGHGGIGQVNMAIQLTQILNTYQPDTVFLVGCGGSYPMTNLKNGDLVLASTEIYGDLGVATESEFIPLEQLNIPQNIQLAPNIVQQFTLDATLLRWGQQLLPESQSGPFVTINCCSGHPLISAAIRQRTLGICENMEGAAAAQVCADFNIPLLELRGISNPTGTRDPQQWDIKAGITAAQMGILKLLDNYPPD